MSESKINICPCCPKGCDLSAPRCGRGEEYLRTGVIPETGNRDRHEECHHGEHCHRAHHRNYEEMQVDEKLFALLGKLGRMGHGAFDGKSSQHRVLHILSKSGRITQRELTAHLGIQPGSVSEIIKKLESAGLITRQSNSEDRRTVDILVTDAGNAQVEASRAQSESALFQSLSEEEKQQLLALLEKVSRDWHHRFRGEHGHHGKKGHDRNDQEFHHTSKHGHKPHHKSI